MSLKSTFLKSPAGKFTKSNAGVKLTDNPISEVKYVVGNVYHAGWGGFQINLFGKCGTFGPYVPSNFTDISHYADPVYLQMTTSVNWNKITGSYIQTVVIDPVYKDSAISTSYTWNNTTGSPSYGNYGAAVFPYFTTTPPPPSGYAYCGQPFTLGQVTSSLSASTVISNNGLTITIYQPDYGSTPYLFLGYTQSYQLNATKSFATDVQQTIDLMNNVTLLDDILYATRSYRGSYLYGLTYPSSMSLHFPSEGQGYNGDTSPPYIATPNMINVVFERGGSGSVYRNYTLNASSGSLPVSSSAYASCSYHAVPVAFYGEDGNGNFIPNEMLWAVGWPNQSTNNTVFSLAYPVGAMANYNNVIFSAKSIIKTAGGIVSCSLYNVDNISGSWSSGSLSGSLTIVSSSLSGSLAYLSSSVLQTLQQSGYFIFDPTNLTADIGRYSEVLLNTASFNYNSGSLAYGYVS